MLLIGGRDLEIGDGMDLIDGSKEASETTKNFIH